MLRLVFILALFVSSSAAQSLVVIPRPQHHRNADPREWSEFPTETERELLITFDADDASWATLQVRQRDVKQNWKIILNEKEIGSLVTDEKDLTTYFQIPPGALYSGVNDLRIFTSSAAPDDIVIGPIRIFSKPLAALLSQATCSISVSDSQLNTPIPSRITILDESRSRASLVAVGDDRHLAIRPGVVYTSTGKAQFGLLPGRYTVFATRGFEYGVDSIKVDIKPGEHKTFSFRIGREVDTRGWIASDTHVHTLTHSGHGDATDRERVITLAGEGIEMPVITDHNVHVDLTGEASTAGVMKWFTPVVGNEVTTKVGHFNVFPLGTSDKPADHRGEDWEEIATVFRDYSRKVIILNHANDVHNGFRPFDPSSPIASMLTKSPFPPNAMEVMNSGSQQTDIMKLFRDWFGLMKEGLKITPVGSSDSHDVSRYIVGQGRTYIRGHDEDPAGIDVAAAVRSIRDGHVMVSAGLLTKIVVNGSYGPGDVVPPSKETVAEITVTGPSWVTADRVMLFVNGELVREENISESTEVIKWTGRWKIDSITRDSFIVAIAVGPGDGMPFWPIEKPYQPSSPDWTPRVIGATAAVWVDGDGDGRFGR
jgi:hypothetical protein